MKLTALPSILWGIPLLLLLLIQSCAPSGETTGIRDNGDAILISTPHYKMNIIKDGFRYSFQDAEGKDIAPAHGESGLRISRSGETPLAVSVSEILRQDKDQLVLQVKTADGIAASVGIRLQPHAVKININPEEEGQYSIFAATAGMGPAYGMADHAAYGDKGGPYTRSRPAGTELTGFSADTLRGYRMIGNFVIFPRQGFAGVNMEPGFKTVRITGKEHLQGSWNVRSMPALYYFLGSPKEIYAAYLEARNSEGYKVYKPKYEWFGVGWEAWGALAWKTSDKTVTENIDEYLERGYPLEWMVIGSGFWPRGKGEMNEHGFLNSADELPEEDRKLLATTSFGMWDERLYPDPKGMIDNFHSKGLKFFIGLRIAFIPGGPFTGEGVEKGYFLKDSAGNAEVFKVGFPVSPVHLLDTRNPDAVDWYVNLCQKWLDYGIDGFKEDLFGYPQRLPDDLIDPVNEALMDEGVYVMGRNMYLGSPADLHRYEDFNYNQFQDRGPINGLAFAYSGFPYVYPDIIGGTGMATGYFGKEPESRRSIYLMRYSEYAALNPGMAFGYGPWNLNEETERVTLKAAQLHDRLQPYMYSNAIRAYQTGFPYTMTPLPLAYPEDPDVYGLADTARRSYEWLIGESLLATPLYGDDYASANSRDVYLPEGTWIEYESGQVHTGPLTLDNYPLPAGKTALFVGGKGMVVEEIDGQMMARIYPVASQASMVFYGDDGEVFSRISLENPDWDNLQVTDKTSGEQVKVNFNRHAHEFRLEKGHEYIVK